MFLLSTLSIAFAFSSSAFASPTGLSSRDAPFKSSVVEKLNGPPAGWTKDDSIRIDKDVEMVKLRIHLVQQGMDKFHDMAMKVYLAIHCVFEGVFVSHRSVVDYFLLFGYLLPTGDLQGGKVQRHWSLPQEVAIGF
jgi:hypothetical protein